MKNWFIKRFALSKEGAQSMIMGCLVTALQDISFMIPVGLMFLLIKDLLNDSFADHKVIYISCIIGVLLLIFLLSFFQYNYTYLATYEETGKRRIHLAETLRKLPLSYFNKKDLTDLTSTILQDCDTLEKVQSHFICPLIGSMISTLLIAIALFALQPQMALAVLWVLPVSFLIILCSNKVQGLMSKRTLEAKLAYESGIQECIEAGNDLRSNNAENAYLEELDQKIRFFEKNAVFAEFGKATFITAASLVLRLGIVTTVLVGTSLLLNGKTDLLTFLFFMLVLTRIYEPLDGSLQNLAMIISTRLNASRVNDILDHPIQTGDQAPSITSCDIVFDKVFFSYADGPSILNGLSFTAKQGEITALVGPSGGGKTTVSRLIARFYDPTKGKITIGGMDTATVEPEKLMALFSMVFQDVSLFNNTIMENIRIGKKDATDEEVLAAAKLANVDEIANRLPEGYQTMIGENGCALSGGERQRISIARAFLKDAPIILLDEATASLDVENETLIQNSLSQLIKNKTVLIIAHRMRSIEKANHVIVLKDGVVAEDGNPTALLQSHGLFSHMCQLQGQSSNWQLNSDL